MSVQDATAAPPPAQQPPQQSLSEEEAALLDRQLRLWGVEAQTRMLNSSVLVYGFRGVGTEVVKTLVLAGVGAVTLLDERDVAVADLGSNFFLRQDDVGQKRVEAGSARAQLLNPRVKLSTRTDKTLLQDENFLKNFNLVVLTDVDASTALRVNAITRKIGQKLYVASSVGIDGWVFADLLDHNFVVDRQKTVSPGETVKVPVKMQQTYVPFEQALQHSFKSMRPREMKRTPDSLWGILSLFEAQRNAGDVEITSESVQAAATSYLPTLDVKPELLSPATASRIASTMQFDFPPSAAVIGGIAGQDALNIVGGKEEPVRNFMVFDGSSSACNVWAIGL